MLSDVCLSEVCLTSVAYIGPKSRTERHRKTKIGIEVAHVIRDTTFKIKRSRSRSQGAGHIVAVSRTACFISMQQNKLASRQFSSALCVVSTYICMYDMLITFEQKQRRC